VRSLWAAGLLLRRLRAEPGMVLVLFLVMAATSFLFAAAPRLFNRVSDDGLRYAALAAPAFQRNVALALVSNLAPGSGGGVSGVRAEGEDLAEQFPPTLASLISERSLLVTAARFSLLDPPGGYETHLALRYQDGLPDATRLVSGRWPVDHGVPLRQVDVGDGLSEPDDEQRTRPVVLEVALSSATAAKIGVEPGDRVAVTMDDHDLAGTFFEIGPTEIEVVGLYEPLDPKADYWSGDASLLLVSLAGTPDSPIAYAAAYIPAEMYPSLSRSGMLFRYEWRFQIDPQRLDAGLVAAVQDDLRHLRFPAASSGLGSPGTVEFRSGLPTILDQYAAQRALSQSILSIAAIGPIGLAGGVLGMVALLLVARRRAALSLARGRGASASLVLGTQLWEAILLAGAASVVGLLMAVIVIPARDSPLSGALAVAVGGAAILLLLAASWPSARRTQGQVERDDPPVFRVAPRRLIVELTIVGIAAGGAILLRQRGLTVGAAGSNIGFDPLLAAVPALSGLAAGIVALRLYPLPVRFLGWLAARRRDLVPVVGLRTIGRHPAAANLPLLVLMLTAAFGAFSSVIVSSIDRGQVFASYLDVGADYRLEATAIGPIADSLDPAAVPGVVAVAPGILDPAAAFASLDYQQATIYLEAVEPRAYDEVTHGSSADPRWPSAFLDEPAGAGLGTEENPIPAILSPRLPVGSAKLTAGDMFRMSVSGKTMTFQIVQRRASFPGLGEPASFAVVPFNWVHAAFADQPLHPSVMWLRAPKEAAEPLAARIAEQAASVRIVSRYDVYARLHDAPLRAAIATGYELALLVAATYMALAIIGAVVLSAARRTQDLAYLRTMGVSAPQALALTVVEHAPPVLLALLPGVALGIGVAFLLEPGLRLTALVGTSGVPLFVDWSTLALLVAVLMVVVAAAVAAGSWLSRRARLVDALRIGED
jgi:putative ABC transport system permease protein